MKSSSNCHTDHIGRLIAPGHIIVDAPQIAVMVRKIQAKEKREAALVAANKGDFCGAKALLREAGELESS